MAIKNNNRPYFISAATRLSRAFWLANGLMCLFSASVHAQLQTDGTTATTLAGSADCTATCFITGSSVAGDNLFHSFSEFNIPAGVDVIFDDGGAANIFSRVSDPTQASNILGNLIVGPGAANFFLINPAGITFGPNAELSLNGGAFVATTAESINFLDDAAFIAGTPTEPVQLTISTPVGLQFGSTAAPIVNLSQAAVATNTLGAPAGLFNPFNTLALIGGDITLLGGNLTAPGGNIALGSVGPDSSVGLSSTAQGFEFVYDTVDTYENIQMLGALVDVGGPGGGQVNLQADGITLDSSGIFGVSFGPVAGGELNLNGAQLNLTDSAIQGITFSTAQGPDVNLSVNQLSMVNGSVISAETQGPGDSGNVTIQGQNQTNADSIVLDTSGLGTEVGPGAAGQGGEVSIQTAVLRLQNNAGIVANTYGLGNGGNLSITATTEISLEETSSFETRADEFFLAVNAPLSSGIVTSSVGNAGNTSLTTDQLTVQGGSQIVANTFGDAGNGGNITIFADTISVAGISENGQPSAILSQVETGPITGNLSTSNGGDILIEARLVELLNDGLIGSTSVESGTAGNITLQNLERLEIIGNNTSSAGIFALGQGNGKAGDINVEAANIRLASRAQITASTETTDGGNVILYGTEDILLRETSRISARAGNGGSGGNITIETPFLIAMPAEDSDIAATAINGPGGNIQITASGILGLGERPAITGNGTNDIDASSQLGTDGTVTINRPYVEPDQGLTNLPEGLADATNQVGEACGNANTSTTGRFTITGRGGLPPTPEAAVQERHLFADLGQSPLAQAQQSSPGEIAETATWQQTKRPLRPTRPLVEAQSIGIGRDGEILLTSQASYDNPHNPQSFYAQCRLS